MNLSYFIPSLPLLSPGLAPGLSVGEFRSLCQAQLTAALAHAAEALLDGTDDEHPFVRAWRDRDAQIRNAVAAERARRRGLAPAETPSRPATGCDASIAPAVAAAFALPDPMRREEALDALRWRILDELQGVEPFSERVVLAYAVRLALCTRTAARDAGRGMDAFKALTAKP